MERGGHPGKVGDETPVVAGKTEEGPDVLGCLGGRPLTDRLELGWVRLDLPSSHEVSKELHLLLTEGALGVLDVKLVLLQPGEDLVEVGVVLLPGGAEDQDVVQVA